MMQLRWRQTSEYHAVSECGFYHIARSVVGPDYSYSGWFGTTKAETGQMSVHVITSPDKDQVVRVLNAHSDQQQRFAAA